MRYSGRSNAELGMLGMYHPMCCAPGIGIGSVACALHVELNPLDFREFWSGVSSGSKSENSGKPMSGCIWVADTRGCRLALLVVVWMA